MLEKFLEYLSLEKRYSPHTVDSYRADLGFFSEFLGEEWTETTIKSLGRQEVRAWMLSQLDDGHKPRSIRRRISALRSFYRWARMVGITEADPSRYLVMPKMEKSLPVFVVESTMPELVALSNEMDFDVLRDLVMVELLYQTGIRNAEIIGLRPRDIDRGNGWLRVLGKGNKERLLPLSSNMIAAIDVYLEFCDQQFGGHRDDHLFLTDKGKKCYPKLVYRIVNKYLGSVSSLSKKSPHVLRHTFATHLLNRGAEINAVKELLGHTSLAATQVYTHTSIEELKEIHQRAHPRNEDGKC